MTKAKNITSKQIMLYGAIFSLLITGSGLIGTEAYSAVRNITEQDIQKIIERQLFTSPAERAKAENQTNMEEQADISQELMLYAIFMHDDNGTAYFRPVKKAKKKYEEYLDSRGFIKLNIGNSLSETGFILTRLIDGEAIMTDMEDNITVSIDMRNIQKPEHGKNRIINTYKSSNHKNNAAKNRQKAGNNAAKNRTTTKRTNTKKKGRHPAPSKSTTAKTVKDDSKNRRAQFNIIDMIKQNVQKNMQTTIQDKASDVLMQKL